MMLRWLLLQQTTTRTALAPSKGKSKVPVVDWQVTQSLRVVCKPTFENDTIWSRMTSRRQPPRQTSATINIDSGLTCTSGIELLRSMAMCQKHLMGQCCQITGVSTQLHMAATTFDIDQLLSSLRGHRPLRQSPDQ